MSDITVANTIETANTMETQTDKPPRKETAFDRYRKKNLQKYNQYSINYYCLFFERVKMVPVNFKSELAFSDSSLDTIGSSIFFFLGLPRGFGSLGGLIYLGLPTLRFRNSSGSLAFWR